MMLAVAADPPGVGRFLSPTGVAALLIFAFIIDYFAVGPAWLQTRLTFITAVTGFRQGFDAGPLDTFTVEKGQAVIQMALDQAKGSYVAGAVPLSILGIGVGILSIYTLGCMVPVKASKKLGRIATLTFKETGIRKVTWPVWALALPLGLLAELPHGWMGLLTTFTVDDLYAFIGEPLPELVFGVV